MDKKLAHELVRALPRPAPARSPPPPQFVTGHTGAGPLVPLCTFLVPAVVEVALRAKPLPGPLATAVWTFSVVAATLRPGHALAAAVGYALAAVAMAAPPSARGNRWHCSWQGSPFVSSYVEGNIALLLLLIVLLPGCATAAPATTALLPTCYHCSYTPTATTH